MNDFFNDMGWFAWFLIASALFIGLCMGNALVKDDCRYGEKIKYKGHIYKCEKVK